MTRSAYIHVPFCAHRCGYCNFTLVARRDDLIEAYLDAVERELSWLATPREVETLFLGGGTPTHLPAEQLERLLHSVLAWHPVASGAEISVEANPLDLTRERLAILAKFGVNRLSLGAQSFRAEKLAMLERDHRGPDVARAVTAARSVAPSVAVDLIFGTPGETLEQWIDDLERAISLGPDHVSTYGLTYERGTTFWSRLGRGELRRADEELERAMYLAAIDRLTAAGFEHYEISNFARPGHRCRHNEVYWSGEPYFAAGPGAARYLDGVRELNHRSTTTYLQRIAAGQSPVAEREQLDPEARARELLVIGLRRIDGVERQSFADRTGFTIDALVARALAKYIDLGLLVDDGQRVRLTRAGLPVSDAIWTEFLRSSDD